MINRLLKRNASDLRRMESNPALLKNKVHANIINHSGKQKIRLRPDHKKKPNHERKCVQ